MPEKGKERQLRHYTLKQLEDLQSRLMLVAGDSGAHIKKGSEKKTEVEVDIFTMVTYFVSLSHVHTCIFE